jgi:hypothetical protein
MANTFELIASSTAGSGGVASFTFTGIPSTYTDLVLKLSVRSVGTSTNAILLRLNGSTSSGTIRAVEGTGSSAYSWTDGNSYAGNIPASSTTASTFASNEVYIPNYAGSANKSSSVDSVTENNATAASASLQANLWSNTAAVTSIILAPNGSNNFAEFSTAYLYGVKNA